MNNKWDMRFLDMAKLVSAWSKDPGKRVGAVIVRPDRSVASVGFNGFPSGMEDRTEWLLDRDEKNLRTVHAELNAKDYALQSGLIKGCTLYTYPCGPCPSCLVQLLQNGVTNFVFPRTPVHSRWFNSIEKSKSILIEMGIEYREIYSYD